MVIIFHNITVLLYFCDHINAALVSKRDFFQKQKILIKNIVWCVWGWGGGGGGGGVGGEGGGGSVVGGVGGGGGEGGGCVGGGGSGGWGEWCGVGCVLW